MQKPVHDANINLDDLFVKENFPKRDNKSHKGSFGRTLLVAGSKQYPGAALLASKGASTIGSGLTSLSSRREVFEQITTAIPEVTHVDFDLDTILEECKKSTVLVIGPGLTTTNDSNHIVCELVLQADIPIILDADGINVLVGKKEIIKKAKKEILLTPHPKELSRLLEIEVDEIVNNKIKVAKNAASELGCTVMIKGSETVITAKDGKTFISPFSNSALAKGGTGDVLTGFIGGLVAQGLDLTKAACIAVYIHGKTAELATKDKTVFSVLPQDLIMYLPEAIKIYI